jgi:hypothetical protein
MIAMRTESSVTSVSWIPREAVDGVTRLPWDLGIAHYDLPPPATIDEPGNLVAGDAARFANELRAWIEAEDGRITAFGQGGRGYIGATRMGLGGLRIQFCAAAFPELRPEPEVGDGWVRFVQTAGAGQACRPRAASATDPSCASSGRPSGRPWR